MFETLLPNKSVIIMVAQRADDSDSNGINQSIRFYEACPVGAADTQNILAGRFTAYIPTEVLNGSEISVILCCGGNLVNSQITVA